MKSMCSVILVQHVLLKVDASYDTMISFMSRTKDLCFFESVVLGLKPTSQEITDKILKQRCRQPVLTVSECE